MLELQRRTVPRVTHGTPVLAIMSHDSHKDGLSRSGTVNQTYAVRRFPFGSPPDILLITLQRLGRHFHPDYVIDFRAKSCMDKPASFAY